MNDKFEQNISRLIKYSNDSEVPSEKFTEHLISEALDQLELKPGKKININIISKIAAVVLIVFGATALLLIKTSSDNKDVQIVSKKPQTSILTVASVNFAFQKGGIKAVDNLYIETLKSIGPRPRAESMSDLFAELIN